MQYNRKFLLARSATIDPTVRSAIAGAEAMTLVTNAPTVARDAVLVTDASGVLTSQPITGTGIAASTSATPDILNSLVDLSATVSGTIASGGTLTLTAPATSVVTTGTTAAGGTLILAPTTNTYKGQKITGTNIAANSFASNINSGTITVSPVTSGAIASAATLTLSTAASVVSTADSINSGNSATLAVAASTTPGIVVGQKASGTNIPAKTLVSSVDYNVGTVVLQSTNAMATKITSGTTVTLAVAGSVVASAPTTPTGDTILNFATTVASGDTVSVGMNVGGIAAIPAGDTITAVGSTTATLSAHISSHTVIPNSSTISFGLGGFSSDSPLLNHSVDNVAAISDTQSLINVRVACPAGSNMNEGSLLAFAKRVAADFAAASGKTFTVESAVAAGNELKLSLISSY